MSPGFRSLAMFPTYPAPGFHSPVISGLPSAVFGAGAVMFGLPSGVRGIPAVGCFHCTAGSALATSAILIIQRVIMAVLRKVFCERKSLFRYKCQIGSFIFWRTTMASWVSTITLFTAFLMFAQQPTADLVLFNGKIITVDERFSIAQAVAVSGDRIVAVGNDADVTRLAG